ncbi:MAG: chaperone modulator CbpM [Burkholderiaceae bacterium]
MRHAIVLADTSFDEGGRITLEELCRTCNVDAEFVELLAEEGLLSVSSTDLQRGFASAEITRVRRIRRLQRDFEASLPAAALMLELLDEIEQLRTALRRIGLDD